MSEHQHRAYLSLGSNIDPEVNLQSALAALRERFGLVLASPVYRTPAVGFSGADFLNMAVAIDTHLDPVTLDNELHRLEDQHGRRRDLPRFSNRPLDIDILFFDDLVLQDSGNLQIPRPELQHAFVLKPLTDIAPDYVVPGDGRTLARLWSAHAENTNPQWQKPLVTLA